MAIRRISELPSLASLNGDINRCILETSYKDENNNYRSCYIDIEDLFIRDQKIKIQSKLDSITLSSDTTNGVSISGGQKGQATIRCVTNPTDGLDIVKICNTTIRDGSITCQSLSSDSLGVNEYKKDSYAGRVVTCKMLKDALGQ